MLIFGSGAVQSSAGWQYALVTPENIAQKKNSARDEGGRKKKHSTHERAFLEMLLLSQLNVPNQIMKSYYIYI